MSSININKMLRSIEKEYQIEDGELDCFINISEDEITYVVSILDEDNNPSDNIDNFFHLQDAIDCARTHTNSGIFTELYRKDKNICEYELVWHPCGDCAEYPDCEKDKKVCSYNQEPGLCPVCRLHNLKYDTTWFEGNQIAYPWTCTNCSATGKEWYNLEFIKHTNVERKEK
jgi:hypothetical protein